VYVTKQKQLLNLRIMSLKEHIEECASECGVDLEVSNTKEESTEYKGHVIETWYDETCGSPLAWNAFVKGFGTYSEYSRDLAKFRAIQKIDGRC
jgi:hypothetical protein